MMCQHNRRARPGAAERPLLVRTPVRVVTAEGAVADQERTDAVLKAAHLGVGPRYGLSQDMSPPGPAIKPSNDIVTEYKTLLTWPPCRHRLS